MEPRILFVGALTLAIVGGTALGTAIDTTPITRGDDPLAALPSHAFALRDPAAASRLYAPQDQYAIETPEGRFEIGELSARGVYRDRRYREAAYSRSFELEDDEVYYDHIASAAWQPEVNFAERELERARVAARAEAVARHARLVAREAQTARPDEMPLPAQGPGPTPTSRDASPPESAPAIAAAMSEPPNPVGAVVPKSSTRALEASAAPTSPN